MQRIGRGNRRLKCTNVACFYRNPIEEAIFKIFIRTAKKSDTETVNLLRSDNNLNFRPSVIVQQLCSYLKQTTYSELDPEHAYKLFATPTGEPLVDKNQYDKIVKHLIEKDFFRSARHGGSQLQAGEKWEKLYEERKIYSNLSGTNESAIVIDNLTGRAVGFLDAKVPPGKTFLIGGHPRQVTAIQGRKILTRADGQAEKIYQPRQKFIRRTKSVALTGELAKELGFPFADEGGKIPIIKIQTEEDGEQRTLLFHNSGEVFGQAIGELLEIEKNVVIIEHNEFFVEISGEIDEEKLQFTEVEMLRLLNRRWKNFENAFDLGHFQTDLPNEARRDCVVSAFNLPKFKAIFNHSEQFLIST